MSKASAAAGNDMSFWLQRQLSAFQQKFDEADTDKSGSLQYSEVVKVLRDAGFHGSDQDLQTIFRFADTNKDAKISRSEYTTALRKAPKVDFKSIVMRRAFRKLDKDNSGFLSRDEILAAAASEEAGLNVPDEKIAAMLISLVKDADGKLDFEEFIQHFNYQSTANSLRALFDKIDKDNSGTLTRKEITDAIAADEELGLKAANISELLVNWCRGSTGKVDYREFATIVANQGQK